MNTDIDLRKYVIDKALCLLERTNKRVHSTKDFIDIAQEIYAFLSGVGVSDTGAATQEERKPDQCEDGDHPPGEDTAAGEPVGLSGSCVAAPAEESAAEAQDDRDGISSAAAGAIQPAAADEDQQGGYRERGAGLKPLTENQKKTLQAVIDLAAYGPVFNLVQIAITAGVSQGSVTWLLCELIEKGYVYSEKIDKRRHYRPLRDLQGQSISRIQKKTSPKPEFKGEVTKCAPGYAWGYGANSRETVRPSQRSKSGRPFS